MKKLIPFIFPTIALAIVVFLGYRWYQSQTRMSGSISEVGEGIEIEDLSTEQMKKLQGSAAKDLPSVTLTGSGESSGVVRYEVQGERVFFTVTADLPALAKGQYQVWLRKLSGETRSKAFVLEMGKAGYMGSASVAADMLPFEVIVSTEVVDDMTVEAVVMTGTLQSPETKE